MLSHIDCLRKACWSTLRSQLNFGSSSKIKLIQPRPCKCLASKLTSKTKNILFLRFTVGTIEVSLAIRRLTSCWVSKPVMTELRRGSGRSASFNIKNYRIFLGLYSKKALVNER